MSKANNIRAIKPIKALRGDPLSIDLGLSYSGTIVAQMKKNPNDPTYRQFTIEDGRYLTMTGAETSDFYNGDILTEAVEGKWYYDVEWTPEVENEGPRTIYRGSILFYNDVTNSNGVQAAPIGEVTDTLFTIEINQENHGLNVGEAIKFNGTSYIKAKADSEENAGVLGLVNTVIDDDNFTYQFGGLFTKGTYIDGESYFLSTETSGEISLKPDYEIGQYEQFVGTATDEGLLINIDFGSIDGSSGGTTLEQEITQLSHGFSIGDAIYFNNVDYVLAQADVVSTSGVIGIVKEVKDASTFIFQFGGIMTEGTWTAGVDYFLDIDTAGSIIPEPTYEVGNVRVFVGQATAQGLLINIDIGQEITEQSSSGGGSQDLEGVTSLGNTTTNGIRVNGSLLSVSRAGQTLSDFNSMVSITDTDLPNGTSLLFNNRITKPGSNSSSEIVYVNQNRLDYTGSDDVGDLRSANNVLEIESTGGTTSSAISNYNTVEEDGSGDTVLISAQYNKSIIKGTGSGIVDYAIGSGHFVSNENPNKTVDQVQVGFFEYAASANAIADSVSVITLDLDSDASSSITTELSYLKIDTGNAGSLPSDAMAIRSLVNLPSEFEGIISVNSNVSAIENATEKVLITKEYGDSNYADDYSGWANSYGNSYDYDLVVEFGDYDSQGNGTNIKIRDGNQEISISASTTTIYGNVNFNSDAYVEAYLYVNSYSGFDTRLSTGSNTAARFINFPDASGTVALTDDLSLFITSDVTNEPAGSSLVGNIVSLTQAEYDAGVPVLTTTYLIKDA
jgi:hypothetical protein